MRPLGVVADPLELELETCRHCGDVLVEWGPTSHNAAADVEFDYWPRHDENEPPRPVRGTARCPRLVCRLRDRFAR